jgi:glucose-1-phosphate thymidylyltransferase
MKGIILAGGSGTRLYPSTLPVCKQLLPIYDKPMVYYPLSVLMLAGIKEILIISTPEDISRFEKMFGDGHQLGMNFSYAVQEHPNGLAEALIIGEEFIGDENVCLILGDNLFYDRGLSELLKKAKDYVEETGGATIFGYNVSDPKRYGVASFDEKGNVIGITEKPINPKSNYAVTGIYFYSNAAVGIAKNVKPSDRGELEITSVNQVFLERGKLQIELLGRGFAWLDTGTHETLLEASEFIHIIEKCEGFKIACIEEIAFNNGWIDKQRLKELAKPMLKNGYGQYLLSLLNPKNRNFN